MYRSVLYCKEKGLCHNRTLPDRSLCYTAQIIALFVVFQIVFCIVTFYTAAMFPGGPSSVLLFMGVFLVHRFLCCVCLYRCHIDYTTFILSHTIRRPAFVAVFMSMFDSSVFWFTCSIAPVTARLFISASPHNLSHFYPCSCLYCTGIDYFPLFCFCYVCSPLCV